MAEYKVPQDVEADDKLLGPFTFRQFIYLLVVAGAIGLGVALFSILPPLALIPLPIIVFFGALALPLKKDQPMETYLSAVVSFYLKPKKRYWIPGERESTILITAPKKVETKTIRNISSEEAVSNLSFLSELVDSQGRIIRGNSSMREEYVAEANNIDDIYSRPSSIDNLLSQQATHHNEMVNRMRDAINSNKDLRSSVEKHSYGNDDNIINNNFSVSATVAPTVAPPNPTDLEDIYAPKIITTANMHKKAMTELSKNQDYTVETIAKEAKRITSQPSQPAPVKPKPIDNNEVYISLR